MAYVTTRKASEALGVCASTLRRWADEGKIRFIRTTTANQRLYDVESFLRDREATTSEREHILYCRVSSAKQKDDLERQITFMRNRYPNHTIVTDVASGINFKRKGLLSILESVCAGNVAEIVVAHKDRLARFGFDLIKWLVEFHGGRIVVLEEVSHSPQQELVSDLLSIITVFSCKMHGLRKYHSKIKEDPDLSECGAEEEVANVDGGCEICL